MKKASASDTKDLSKELRSQIIISREERAQIEAILSSIGEGLIATNEKGYVIQVNQIALDTLGYKRNEILGKWFTGVIPAFNEDGSPLYNVDRPITRMFITGQSVSEKIYYQRKDGIIIPVSLIISPILLRNKPIGAIEIFRNISLEMENDKMKTEFISIASHQLRTPLSSIYTYSNMIAEGYAGKLNDKQASFMGTIISAANRMNELISTLLNVTRVEAGNITINSKSISLTDEVNETVIELIPEIERKNINLTTDLANDLPQVNTDRLIVREIFTNLLANAVKYTPVSGSIHIKLFTKGNDLIFRIKDTGYGIPANAQSRIFTKFFRASNANQVETSGTGLGLYLIKILAEMINGELWFKSRENHGSSFYFSISKNGSVSKEERFSLESSK